MVTHTTTASGSAKTAVSPGGNGPGTAKAERITMVQALNRAFAEEMERDPTIVILGEDVGVDGGVFRVTQGLQAKFGGDRVIDTPLAESAIAGTAVGLAIGGMRPVAEVQFSGFMNFAYEQLQPHASRFRQRTCAERDMR